MHQKILIIGLVWPESQSSAAGSRMMQLVKLFLESGMEVVFGSAAQRSDFSDVLDLPGLSTQQLLLNDSSFDDFVTALHPDIVLFDRFISEEQFGWRVAAHCQQALRILDTEDLHCLRLARQLAVKQQRDFTIDDLFSDTAKREISSILRCDLSLIISEYEMQLLQKTFKIDPILLYYLPFLPDVVEGNTWPGYKERSGFMFIGNFYHEPNKDAVRYLKEQVWPAVRVKMPEAVLFVYGAYLPAMIQQMHDPKTGFIIAGRAVSAEEAIKSAKVMLAPLRFGAGMKGKLLEAMICGTPTITTSIGAEGMPYQNLWNGFITDDVMEFADFAVKLYEDAELWTVAQSQGTVILKGKFDKSIYEKDFLNHIYFIINNLKEHRRNNFIGSVLLYDAFSATKYMSRWIEEKNKNNYKH
ncbi:glycosyltransferase [Flavobacterium pallidum]|uniref:Glycosyltransferase n=1 Tax=Flavobacterium pallidum TaxID=2172098 RepID=A0A2S1SLI1_9FLAO|nr:glycosyltransferase [Flavobacterium pallidum]AWI27212.1 glycosyltransferase [Flavobacterium pallidum]